MLSEQERAEILAFVHGELDQVEAQKLAGRIEIDAELRKEFEAMLAASDSLEDLFVKPATDGLSANQVAEILRKAVGAETLSPKRWRRSFFAAGSIVLAASLAFMVFMRLDLATDNTVEVAKINEIAEPPSSSDQVTAEGATAPPVDNLVTTTAAQATAELDAPVEAKMDAQIASAVGSAEPTLAAPEAQRMADSSLTEDRSLAPAKSENNASELQHSASPAPAAGAPVAESFGQSPEAKPKDKTSKKPRKKMAIVASSAKFSASLNRKKALLHLQRQLDGQTSCVPLQLARLKTVQAVITVRKDGLVTKIQTTPHSSNIVKCLKAKLSGKPPAFKSKAGGKITLQLKNF